MIFLTLLDVDERTSIENIYTSHGRKLLSIANSILKDHHEAQDAVQQSFEKLVNRRSTIDLKDQVRAYAYLKVIVRNQSIDMYNKKKRITYKEPEYIENLEIIDDTDIERDLINFENSKELALKLDQLNPKYATVITLKYFLELENTEIADTLDCSESTLRVILHRAKKSLKNVLRSEVS